MLTFPYKRAMVTGGAGFIGSHIVEELLRLGVDVMSIDDYSAGKWENYGGFNDLPGRLFPCTRDVTNYGSLIDCMDGIEVVFHNAASKKTVCLRDPKRDLEVNAAGTFNLLDLSLKHGVKKFVHASTGSVYGEPILFPQDENHPVSPTSFYGVSKLAGERYVDVFHKLHALDTTVLRYFHVYGPRQESSDIGGVVPIFIKALLEGKPIRIFGNGSQQRSFTYVKDVVRANLEAAASEASNGKVYNCASGIRISIKRLADTLARMLGVENPEIKYESWQSGDIREFDVNNYRIRRDFGMTFTDFEIGLEETIRWGKETFVTEKEFVVNGET